MACVRCGEGSGDGWCMQCTLEEGIKKEYAQLRTELEAANKEIERLKEECESRIPDLLTTRKELNSVLYSDKVTLFRLLEATKEDNAKEIESMHDSYKYQLSELRAELEKERKCNDKIEKAFEKVQKNVDDWVSIGEANVSELEAENAKQAERIRELEKKLEKYVSWQKAEDSMMKNLPTGEALEGLLAETGAKLVDVSDNKGREDNARSGS